MARRKSDYWRYSNYGSSRPIETKDGIKAHSKRGSFVKNWWATCWIKALEKFVDSGRLTRGRNYARRGQVLSIEETRAGISARVQGSRKRPYIVTIQVTPLTDAEWHTVIDVLSEQALFTAQLLAGEMPQDIEVAFNAANVSLFPTDRGDLITDCNCPDYANPCKHIAATHYILGERFDEDPFLLFRMRGRTQDQILEALRQRRAGQEIIQENEETHPEILVPLEETLDHFWELASSLDAFSVAIRPPDIKAPLLRRLGEPTFVSNHDLQALLLPAYEAITNTALEIALSEKDGDGSDSLETA